jgi:hypothetical protein
MAGSVVLGQFRHIGSQESAYRAQNLVKFSTVKAKCYPRNAARRIDLDYSHRGL